MALAKSLLKVILSLAGVLALLTGGAVLLVPGIHVNSLAMARNVMTGSSASTATDILLARLQAADGYNISIFARELSNPRMLLRDSAGRLLVSNPRSGEILQLWDDNNDGAADRNITLLTGLKRPHGMELHGNYLYIAESHQIGRISYDAETGSTGDDYSVIIADLTDEGNHWSKTVRIGADDKLYVAMGSTCNVCEETDPRRATIMRYELDGSSGEIYASGLRNSVGMAFAPWDGALYATDNGRDLLGDDYPACELNHIEQQSFYGWPYLNGDNDLDPDFGAGREDLQKTASTPVFSFAAHNAPLGIYFPSDGSRSAVVALHGSWNRSSPDGYKLVKLSWQDGQITSSEFMWGFEQAGDIIGRPVDIVGDGAGGFFVSDDYARTIYRLSKNVRLSSATKVPAQQPADPVVSWSIDSSLASSGQKLYQNLPCADCHGDTALTPVRLLDLAQRYDPESLTEYFLTPTPPMPRFDLSLQQRQQLAHYLLSRDQSPAER